MTNRRQLGKYEVLRELGRGGFGIVYEAKDLVLGRHVALKVLHSQHIVDPFFLKRFEQEAKLAAQLEHPNLVPVHDFGQVRGYNYIVMGLMHGGSLKDRLLTQGAFDPNRAKIAFEQILEGVSYIHQNGVIHRDLKPSNILFDHQDVARISDLGFAKAVRYDVSSSMSTSGSMVGTAAYMAPEIWYGKKATEQSDIYSLGCIAYEMLTGNMLFSADSPAVAMTKHLVANPKMDANLPESWRKLILKCLAKSPAERYPTAMAVLEDLKFGLSGSPAGTQRKVVFTSAADKPKEEDKKQKVVQAPPSKPKKQSYNTSMQTALAERSASQSYNYNTFYYRGDGQTPSEQQAAYWRGETTMGESLTPGQMLELSTYHRQQKKKPWLIALVLFVLLALIATGVWAKLKSDKARRLGDEPDSVTTQISTPGAGTLYAGTLTPVPTSVFDSANKTKTMSPVSPTQTHIPTEVELAKYSLTITIEGQGWVSPNGGTYEDGTSVTLMANPEDGWEFSRWSTGATSSTLMVTMDSNKTIKAIFTKKAPVMYSLTITVDGQGWVNPNGGSYEAGSRVTLTANPSDGWQFTNWSTGSSNPTIIVTMNSNMTIKAIFTKIPVTKYTLTVNIDGQGTVSPNGGSYEAGTSVSLTANPSDGWQFTNWSTGATSPTITVLMDSNKSIGAVFVPDQPPMYTLTVKVIGNGWVSPNGGTYEAGVYAVLTATPAAGWEFTKWSSGLTCPSIAVLMDSDKYIEAIFTDRYSVHTSPLLPDSTESSRSTR